MVSWSLVASCQAFLSGRGSFWATRLLLGLIEGGFIPDNILYLSYFYTSAELPIRLSWFWVSYQSTSIVSAFLAYGILHMRGINGLAGWRWYVLPMIEWLELIESQAVCAGGYSDRNYRNHFMVVSSPSPNWMLLATTASFMDFEVVTPEICIV